MSFPIIDCEEQEHMERKTITEAYAEQITDARVCARLLTDEEYLNAADAEAREEREQEISEEEFVRVSSAYNIEN